MVRIDLPYLWAAKGRRRFYWFYRRDGRLTPITAPDGSRLSRGDAGFLEAYERIHADFEAAGPDAPAPGSLAHLIIAFKAAPEFLQLAARTRAEYGRYLDVINAKWGHLSVATMPREAVLKLRDDYQATPRTANYLTSVLRLLLSFAEDRPQTFRLPRTWHNPARRPRMLRTGKGHRPWEEIEIVAYRKHWPLGTFERVLFEAFLNSGQRGGDVAPMIRRQYFKGEIAVAQEKTGERIWIPASRDLRAALDPWLKSHKHVVLFPTPSGRPLKVDHMRHAMRAAIRAAELPDDCTLHGLRYTFATRAIELGLDWQTIEAIVGHKTAEMASKYTAKRRAARFAIATLEAARTGKLKTAADRSENRPRGGGVK
jgi:integrase